MSNDLWWVKGIGASRGEHMMHDTGQSVTDTKVRETSRGGRVDTPRVQGCSTTSMTSVESGSLPEGEARRTESSEFTLRPGSRPQSVFSGERAELTTAKRIVILLNVSPQPQTTAGLQASGFSVVHLLGFGTPQEPTSTLMSVKRGIREGRVLWLHGRVKPQHWTKPTWFTQCCRLAHRAAAQWSLEFRRSPWHIKPFEALRRHRYVRDIGTTASASWFGSELVHPQTISVEQVLEQAAQLQNATGDSARWLGDHTNIQGEVTRKNLRRAEDQTAVGGLRSPRKSLKQIRGATEFGKWLAERG